MRKWVFMIAGILFLAGCADAKTVTPETTENEPSNSVESAEPVEDAIIEESGENEKDASESLDIAEKNSSLENYEEYQILSEKIDLSVYQAKIETDNSGNRVLLFSEANGRKVYKSIFIKHDQYLKIIKLGDEGLIYNGKLN